MARSASLTYSTSASRLALGFLAAFLATLTFHQLGVEILHLVGVTPNTPYRSVPVPPFGVPQVVSLAFWGGVWGFVFVLLEPWFVRSPGGYWFAAIAFGAIFPTGASWFIVAPLKGLPLGYGFRWPGLIVGPIVNGLWGLGTALFLGVLTGWRGRPG